MAWPAFVIERSLLLVLRHGHGLRRSAPIITLSLASSNSSWVTMRLERRAASRAASLTRFIRSAPVKPGVPRAITRTSTSGASGTLRMWTAEDLLATRDVGIGHHDLAVEATGGAASGGSSTSGRLAAAMMITPSLGLEPVHLDEQLVERLFALSHCRRRGRAAMATDRVDLVDEMMQGEFFLACSNMSRTRLAPTPTNISTKSEPEIVKNGTFARRPRPRAVASFCRFRAGHKQHAAREWFDDRRSEFSGDRAGFDDFLKVFLGPRRCRGNVIESDAAMRLGSERLGLRLSRSPWGTPRPP